MKFGKKKTVEPDMEMPVPDLQDAAEAPEGGAEAATERGGLFTRLSQSLKGLRKGPKKATDLTHTDVELVELGVLALGKKKTAIGLTWTPVDSDTTIRARVAEMDELNTQDPTQATVEFKFYTDPKGSDFMGLGSLDWGQKSGMPALVTMLDPELTGPRWLGAFLLSEANDTWWVASMRDGKVFGDQILHSRHQAEQAFLNDLEAPDWTAVYAPADWGVPQTSFDPLHELVDLGGGVKLKSLTPVKDSLPRLIMGAAVVGIGVAGAMYLDHRRAEELQRLEELRRRAEAGMSFSPRDLPWYQSTPLGQFIATCMDQIDTAIILVPGWEAQPISCTVQRGNGTVSTGWNRAGGRFTWLRAGVSPDDPQPLLASNGQTATWSRSFNAPIDEDAIKDQPWEGHIIESRMRERFQVLDTELALRPTDSNRQAAGVRPVFNSHDMRISAPYGVKIFGDILDDVPALVPQGLIYNPQTGAWDLAIKVYHPPIFPPEAH